MNHDRGVWQQVWRFPPSNSWRAVMMLTVADLVRQSLKPVRAGGLCGRRPGRRDFNAWCEIAALLPRRLKPRLPRHEASPARGSTSRTSRKKWRFPDSQASRRRGFVSWETRPQPPGNPTGKLNSQFNDFHTKRFSRQPTNLPHCLIRFATIKIMTLPKLGQCI
jgi:hypothetical protein